jgi:hypothetical protein
MKAIFGFQQQYNPDGGAPEDQSYDAMKGSSRRKQTEGRRREGDFAVGRFLRIQE